MSATAVKLSSGHRITVDGSIGPSHAGQLVLLEQGVNGAWKVFACVRLNRKSRYAARGRGTDNEGGGGRTTRGRGTDNEGPAVAPSDATPNFPASASTSRSCNVSLLHRTPERHPGDRRLGRAEARRQILGEVVRAWVDEIPSRSSSLTTQRRWPISTRHDLSMLAAWHASLEVRASTPEQGVSRQRLPVAGREPARGAENRRRVFVARRHSRRGSGGAGDGTVLPWLPQEAASSSRGVPRALLLGPGSGPAEN